MPKVFRSSLATSALVSILVSVGIVGLRATGSLESLELAAYDWNIRLRPQAPVSESPIVLIGITEADIRKQGLWPSTDSTLAEALEILTRYRARVIGLDIFRDVPVPPGREKLEAILTSNRNIIAVMKFGDEGSEGIPSPSVLKNTDQVGFNDILVDPGGIVRRGLLLLDDGKTTAYAFALRLALLYLRAEGTLLQPDPINPQHVNLGNTTIPPFETNDGGYVGADARGYQFLLDFKGGPEAFPFFSLTSLLSGEIDPKVMSDKIVLIGVVAEGVKDFFYSPYSRGLQAEQQISGIELHAHIVSQLVRLAIGASSPITAASEWQEGLWIFLWSTMGGVLGLWVRSPWNFSLLGASGLLLLGLLVYFAFLSAWWVPFVPPAMAWLITASLVTAYISNQEKTQRALLMQLFSKNVSKEVAEAIWQQREHFLANGRLRPQRLIATVLFTDLIGFTSVSERLRSELLMDWLNQYMGAMGQTIIAHGGVINKYIGDSIMAVFGAPLARNTEEEISRDATNAVSCALSMGRTLIQLNTDWKEQDLPTIRMRIGIFTGPVVAGSLGSAERWEYTVIGDTVNTAARLESFDKDLTDPDLMTYPYRVLIGEATLRRLGNQFQTKKVGEVSLKGKDEKVTIHRVIGRAEQIATDLIQEKGDNV